MREYRVPNGTGGFYTALLTDEDAKRLGAVPNRPEPAPAPVKQDTRPDDKRRDVHNKSR